MKNLTKQIFLISIMLVISSFSYGQYQGPGKTDKTYTIKEIKDNATRLDRSDVMVKVKGFIVKQIHSNTYQFKDSSGTINVEIKKKNLPTRPFDDKTEVIITGEVDYDFLDGTEIEVEQITFPG